MHMVDEPTRAVATWIAKLESAIVMAKNQAVKLPINQQLQTQATGASILLIVQQPEVLASQTFDGANRDMDAT